MGALWVIADVSQDNRIVSGADDDHRHGGKADQSDRKAQGQESA